MLRRLIARIFDLSLGSGDVVQSALSVHSSPHNTEVKVRVSLVHAANGRILEVSVQNKKNNFGSDWDTEMYIVEEGQTLSAAIGLIMTMKGLEK